LEAGLSERGAEVRLAADLVDICRRSAAFTHDRVELDQTFHSYQAASDRPPGLLPVPIAQPALEQLARRLARQGVVEHDHLRDLVAREPLADVVTNRVLGQARGRVGVDVRGERLAVLGEPQVSSRDKGLLSAVTLASL
jgi:hypothetical protein